MLIDDLVIAIPCNVKWEEMQPRVATPDGRLLPLVSSDRPPELVGGLREIGHRARHCRRCDRNVYDVSTMTREEAESFIATSEGEVCLRLYRRPDGRLVTAECQPQAAGLAPQDLTMGTIPLPHRRF